MEFSLDDDKTAVRYQKRGRNTLRRINTHCTCLNTARMRGIAHIGVIAQGCVKKARTKCTSISAQLSELSHRGAKNPGNTHFGREVACYRECFYIVVCIFEAPLLCVWHRGDAHVEITRVFSLNRHADPAPYAVPVKRLWFYSVSHISELSHRGVRKIETLFYSISA